MAAAAELQGKYQKLAQEYSKVLAPTTFLCTDAPLLALFSFTEVIFRLHAEDPSWGNFLVYGSPAGSGISNTLRSASAALAGPRLGPGSRERSCLLPFLVSVATQWSIIDAPYL